MLSQWPLPLGHWLFSRRYRANRPTLDASMPSFPGGWGVGGIWSSVRFHFGLKLIRADDALNSRRSSS